MSEDPIGAYNIEDEEGDYGYEREDMSDSDEIETGVNDDFGYVYADL